MYKAIIKVFCGVLGAVVTLVSLSIDDRSTDTERVNLQSPSLMYASMSNRYSNASIVPDDDEEMTTENQVVVCLNCGYVNTAPAGKKLRFCVNCAKSLK